MVVKAQRAESLPAEGGLLALGSPGGPGGLDAQQVTALGRGLGGQASVCHKGPHNRCRCLHVEGVPAARALPTEPAVGGAIGRRGAEARGGGTSDHRGPRQG